MGQGTDEQVEEWVLGAFDFDYLLREEIVTRSKVEDAFVGNIDSRR